MFKQFSHNYSLIFAAPTKSGIKLGHLCGQSCLTICTKTLLIFVTYALSFRNNCSSPDKLITKFDIKFLIPSLCYNGNDPHRNLITESKICNAKNFVFALFECSNIPSTLVHICSFSCICFMICSASCLNRWFPFG